MKFKLDSTYRPAGDQPEAIRELCDALRGGVSDVTLLGVTGSGKTFTMANVIERMQRPALILSHNKTLAAQLYGEFKAFFPANAVEYFVSYYDYYQPEAYIPSTDTYIEKDLSINDRIEKLRLSAAGALLSGRRDVIVISSVSCLYGIGNPEDFHEQTIQSDENSIDGNYLQLYDAATVFKCDGTDWNDTGYHFEYWPGNWNSPETYEDPDGIDLTKVVDFTNFANMALKFEMRIPADHPWTGCPMQIYFASLKMCTLGTANNTYFHDDAFSLPRVMYRPWKSTGSFDTGGKWITVSFPIESEFVYDWGGGKASGQLSADSFAGFEIFFAAGSSDGEGTPCTPLVQIDNIRVVPCK